MIERVYERDRNPTKLAGGFNAALSPREANVWHEHLGTVPEWAELLTLEAEQNVLLAQIASGRHDVADRFIATTARRREVERALYAIGKAWFAEIEKVREAARVAERGGAIP